MQDIELEWISQRLFGFDSSRRVLQCLPRLCRALPAEPSYQAPRPGPTGFTRSSMTALHVTTFRHVPTESSRREKSCDANK